jgi:transcriptional regulator with XRE-family HTH domain
MPRTKPKGPKVAPEVLTLGFRGDRLKEQRELAKLTQMDVAVAIGSAPSYVSFLERGGADVAGSRVAAMARILPCSADYLLNLTDDPKPHGRK